MRVADIVSCTGWLTNHYSGVSSTDPIKIAHRSWVPLWCKDQRVYDNMLVISVARLRVPVSMGFDIVRVSSRMKLGGDWAQATDRRISHSPAARARTSVMHIARTTGGRHGCLISSTGSIVMMMWLL